MTEQMKYGNDYKKLPVSSERDGKGTEVRPDVYMYTNQIVNVAFIGNPEAKEFVLIDAGMPESSQDLLEAVKERFGENCRARAIVLTHGHFDHVGSVIELAEKWECPIYAHQDEMPHLTGEKSYPMPDDTAEGGEVTKMSPEFPTDPIDLGKQVEALPANGSVPHLPAFQWIHTPGHTKGQVALFRDEDGLLISADAFVATNQDDLDMVEAQKLEINGPPRYLTTDWEAAKDSVSHLQELNPQYAITGHGPAVEGEELKNGLDKLVQNWEEIAVPAYGRYVDNKK